MMNPGGVFCTFFLWSMLILLANAFHAPKDIRREKSSHSSLLRMTTARKDVETSGRIVSFKSPCKINLFLRITGKRPDGYHELASLFQTISLHDNLSFEQLPRSAVYDDFTCSDPTLTVGDGNLIIKALQLMRRKTGMHDRFFKVHLDKQVPMQAGLGGGSGNAATAMFAFNQLTQAKIPESTLQNWAGEIGSDISFFFSSGTAFCTGRGEKVQSLAPLKDHAITDILVCKPSEGLSTAAVFQAFSLAQCSDRSAQELLQSFESNGLLQGAHTTQALVNDLESPSFSIAPRLSRIKFSLTNIPKAQGAMMSGSGTSLYALLPKNDADPLQRQAQATLHAAHDNIQTFCCTALNRPFPSDTWYQ